MRFQFSPNFFTIEKATSQYDNNKDKIYTTEHSIHLVSRGILLERVERKDMMTLLCFPHLFQKRSKSLLRLLSCHLIQEVDEMLYHKL